MAHNYAADSTFQDVMARLAGTDAPFSAVWPTLKGAILSGRALTAAEYRPLNALISEAHATRIARNEALNSPHMHSTVGEVANSVGATDEPAQTSPTDIPASHIEKVNEEITKAAEAPESEKTTDKTIEKEAEAPDTKAEADDKKSG
ncbi:hypothetical protein [Komagataeibacter medellinensis]|uniref:Uncharacterized protein n=1 Tax=Komagataeibacter medellinensis (strain NBRC 3288 / BCRC 11682 / LMG 1693 / Kondo 51) TaxID=634177 RepID=G2I788_KOMMN|nr:hypothetical protein [Komagataeibacter medellinensis]BAK83985.1 hypothetical protein GLX_15730 [Komagataeibacter medellinensis NBRC 3288]